MIDGGKILNLIVIYWYFSLYWLMYKFILNIFVYLFKVIIDKVRNLEFKIWLKKD